MNDLASIRRRIGEVGQLAIEWREAEEVLWIEIGAMMQQERKAAGIIQADLAEMIGCGRKYVVQMESGERRYLPHWIEKAREAMARAARESSKQKEK